MAPRTLRTFLIESYVPQLDKAVAVALSLRLRAATADLQREGRAVRWLRSFALVDEQTYMCMLNAGDIEQATLVNERAGVACDHVVEVIAVESPGF